jgi:5-methylthioadenosine/S-adenosylhomocysteine deaminase
MKSLILKAVLIVLAAGVLMIGAILWQKPWDNPPTNTYVKTTAQTDFNVDTLIINAQVVTLNSNLEVLPHGWIAIKDGVISAIGSDSVDSKIKAKNTIDAANNIVMPGLLNLHAHMGMTNLNGKVPNQKLSDWLKALKPLEDALSQDDVFNASKLGYQTALKNGTTLVNDMYSYPAYSLLAAQETGIRAIIRLPLIKKDNSIIIDPVFPRATSSLISFSLAPNPLEQYSLSELTQIAALAENQNLPVHIHFEADSPDNATFKKKYKLSPLGTLQKSGLINQKLILAHGVYLTTKEIPLLANYKNTGVISAPRSEKSLLTPITPVLSYLQAGEAIGIGTDGSPSSGSLDEFLDMRELYQSITPCDNPLFCKNNFLKPEFILKAATIDGAKIIGQDKQIGSIEVGKSADLILINADNQIFTNNNDLYTWLVQMASGQDVYLTIINGVVIYKL